jgi:hypothetical protein
MECACVCVSYNITFASISDHVIVRPQDLRPVFDIISIMRWIGKLL